MMQTAAGRIPPLVVAMFLVLATGGGAAAEGDHPATGTPVQTRLIDAAFQLAIQAATGQGGTAREQPPLTLQDALAQARVNSQLLRSAVAAAQSATEDRVQARAALLPSLSGFGQYIYTQPNGTPSGVFVANDGPHVYNLWGTVHGDLFALSKWADYRSASAGEAVAQAKAEVASRGLVSAVVQAYYGLVAAVRKAASAGQSLNEAQQFLEISQRLEQGGEVAHSDVVKAQIEVAQRDRDAREANLLVTKNRLLLSVLVFPDFRENFAVVDDLQNAVPLPTLQSVTDLANKTNPDVRAAQATVNQEAWNIWSARGALFPSMSFDYFYGIDANQFAIYNPDHQRLLGSVAQAQVTVPLWNWGATQAKMKQAELRTEQARADLSLTERQLLANINTFYAEAEAASAELDSLRTSLDLATESLRLTLLRYQAAEVSVLEVVDAQTTLIQARNAYDDGLVRYRVALAALQTLTGTL